MVTGGWLYNNESVFLTETHAFNITSLEWISAPVDIALELPATGPLLKLRDLNAPRARFGIGYAVGTLCVFGGTDSTSSYPFSDVCLNMTSGACYNITGVGPRQDPAAFGDPLFGAPTQAPTAVPSA